MPTFFRRSFTAFLAIALSTAVALPSAAQSCPPGALTCNTFDASVEGWTTIDDATNFHHEATGGNPGGFIEADDIGSGGVWYFSAPASYLGDQSDAYGGSLDYDLEIASLVNPYDDVVDLQIVGANGTTLYYDHPQAGTSWATFSAPLTSVGWTNATASGPATEADMIGVLADVSEVNIRGEYVVGATNDTGRLDNVVLYEGPPCVGAAPVWDGTVVTGGDTSRYLRVEAACGLEVVEFWNTNNLSADGAFLSGDGGTSFTPASDYSPYSTGSCTVAEPGLTDCQGFVFTGTPNTEADELWIRVSPSVPGNPSRFFLALTDTEGTTTNIDPVLDGEAEDTLPAEAVLHGAYPNPFNPTTRVAFELPESGAAHLAVFDVLGRRVATLFDGTAAAGRFEAVWDGRDAAGLAVPSGVYLIRLATEGRALTRSVTLLK